MVILQLADVLGFIAGQGSVVLYILFQVNAVWRYLSGGGIVPDDVLRAVEMGECYFRLCGDLWFGLPDKGRSVEAIVVFLLHRVVVHTVCGIALYNVIFCARSFSKPSGFTSEPSCLGQAVTAACILFSRIP